MRIRPLSRSARPVLAATVVATVAASIVSAVALPNANTRTAVADRRQDGQPASTSPGPSQTPSGAGPSASPSQSAQPLYPLPAAAVNPTGCPPRPAPPGYGVIKRPPKPKVAEAKVPAPIAQPSRVVDTSAVTGTGIWVTIFKGEAFTRAQAADVVTHAVHAHMTSIWLRTGSAREGLFGQPALATLLPLAHSKGIKVIAWDFPNLSDPAADARRLVATLDLAPGGQQVDGVSGDVETVSEGVFLTGKRAAAYFSRVSAYAGSRPVVATVLRPTNYWWSGAYPYRAETPFVDAFAPMVYWSCTEPGAATAQAVTRLRSLGKPVNAIGQAYDEGPYGRRGTPSPREIWRFLDVAKRRGAAGASLYYATGMRGPLWAAVGAYPWK